MKVQKGLFFERMSQVASTGIPENEWQIVLSRVAHHESYRTIAKDYQVSRETIRRLVQAAKQAS